MKTIFLILGLALAPFSLLKAQQLQFASLAGNTFTDMFRFDRGNAMIGYGFTYGGTLSYTFRNNSSIGLTYIRQDCGWLSGGGSICLNTRVPFLQFGSTGGLVFNLK